MSDKNSTRPDTSLSSWAGKNIICVGDYLTERDDLPPLLKENNDASDHNNLKLYKLALEKYSFISSDCLPCDTQQTGRILRNLTTKEFVREDILQNLTTKEFVREKEYEISLGHVVLMRIC